MLLALLIAQVAAAAVLMARLAPGRHRPPPVEPLLAHEPTTPTTIVVATLNEARRIGPLLDGATAQGPPVHEIIVVDSESTDGTRDLVRTAAARDPRVRLETDPPLPPGWIGKAWALQHALDRATGHWVLGLDADTAPRPGLAAAVVATAERLGFDAVSFGPRFAGQTALERWLQPALLTTLIYRNGATGEAPPPPDRVMANGQCFLVKRDVLRAAGGYAPVRASFAEDVSLARHLARGGARVGFLDGARLYDVRSYASAGEMWREWGRSIDLKDATTPTRLWGDVALLLLTQAAPLWVVVALLATGTRGAGVPGLYAVNGFLLFLRWQVLRGAAGSYADRGAPYWLSPLADALAWVRIVMSALVRPRRWRAREYGPQR